MTHIETAMSYRQSYDTERRVLANRFSSNFGMNNKNKCLNHEIYEDERSLLVFLFCLKFSGVNAAGGVHGVPTTSSLGDASSSAGQSGQFVPACCCVANQFFAQYL